MRAFRAEVLATLGPSGIALRTTAPYEPISAYLPVVYTHYNGELVPWGPKMIRSKCTCDTGEPKEEALSDLNVKGPMKESHRVAVA